MAQSTGSSSFPPPPPQKGDDVAFWANQLTRWLKKTQAIPGANILSTQTQSGRVFNAKPGGGVVAIPPHPWKATRNDDSETEPATKRVRVHPGSIGGVVPTNVLASANDGLTITGTGLEYVVLNCVAESATIQSCSLSIESTQPPSPSATEAFPPEEFQDLIAVISDGTILQIRDRNITATSVLALKADTEEAEPFRENVIRFYTWILGG